MPDALPVQQPDTSAADVDPLVQQLLAKFSAPPAAPNIIPFQQAKANILQQQQALQPPKAPTLQQIPQDTPAAQVTPIFQAMTPDLMLFAALGGALTRAPIASTVENMTGFINGLHQGDAEATKNHLDEFTAKLNAAKDANQQAIDQYKLAFDGYNGDVQKLKDQLDSIASMEGDTLTKYQIDNGQFDEVYKLIDARQRLNDQLQNHQDMVNLRIDGAWKDTTLHLRDGSFVSGQKNAITGGYRDAQGNDIDASEVKDTLAGVPVEALATPETAQRAAEQAWAGDYHDAVASASGMGNVGNVNRGIIANAITQYGKQQGKTGADIAAKIAEFHGQLAAATTAGHIIGSTAQGAQEIQQFVPIINNLSQQIDRTRFPDLNSIELAVRKGTGDPAVVAFNSYVQSAKNAYALVMTRGGRTTDAARKRSDELLSPNLNVDQVATALQAMSLEASIAQTSAVRATQEVTGQSVTGPTATGAPTGGNSTTSKW